MNQGLDHSLPQLIEALLASYQGQDTGQRIGSICLPSRADIVGILERVRQLLFPGYFGHKNLTQQSISSHVSDLVAELAADLAYQIRIWVCTCGGPCKMESCRASAEAITHDFLARLPQIRENLVLDLAAFYDGDPAAKSLDEIIFCYPGFYGVTVHRIAHELLQLEVPLIPRIMTEYAHHVTGTDIHPGATIGRRFFIDHATGVVIGETARIGDHVKIYQGVTLGAKSFPKDERGRVIKGFKRHPTIEDNVTIYANATILGGDTVIGKGATIAGNVFITESVPPNSLVTQDGPQLQVVEKRPK